MPLPVADHPLTIIVLGMLGLLVVLSVFAFRTPGLDLIDYRSLPEGASERVVGDLLGDGPGDPTEAIVTMVDGDSVAATADWAKAVVGLPQVAWVDTASFRYSGVGSAEIDPATSLASPEQVGVQADGLAVIVPAVPMRSPEGAELRDRLDALADGRVQMMDPTNSDERGSLTLIVVTLVLLAAAGAAAVMVETENAGYALTSFALALLGGAAVAGLFRMVSSDATAAEVIAALAVVGALSSLYELEFLHDRFRQGLDDLDRLHVAIGPVDPDLIPESLAEPHAEPVVHLSRGPVPGRAVLLASLVLLPGILFLALSRFVGGGPTVGRFGLALTLGLLVEVAVGFIVLRPALLGERAVYHTVARPLRSALHAGSRPQRSRPVSVDDPTWRRLITDLLVAEFGFQTDPDAGRLDDVFLDGTPLFRQAGEQHRSLSQSGLRVTGRAPQIKKVEAFRQGPSTMLSVTVDHPERHLVDNHGTVYGVRRPQRRSTMLWLVAEDDGRVRIAESIDLGVTPLDVEQEPVKTSFPEVASIGG